MPNERHKQSFDATNDRGEPTTLHVFVQILNTATFGDPYGESEGLKRILTDEGQAVNRLAKGKYQVVVTGETLTSDDPDAP